MKIFQVEDDDVEIIESVLDSLSRINENCKQDGFVFGMLYSTGEYNIGYVNASPANMAAIAGYIQLDANFRYVKLNKSEFEQEGY